MSILLFTISNFEAKSNVALFFYTFSNFFYWIYTQVIHVCKMSIIFNIFHVIEQNTTKSAQLNNKLYHLSVVSIKDVFGFHRIILFYCILCLYIQYSALFKFKYKLLSVVLMMLFKLNVQCSFVVFYNLKKKYKQNHKKMTKRNEYLYYAK